MANRLAAEKSPYLLQHAHNPVDWYPWGDEAFARARARGQADLSVDRLLDLPLVPRHGARVVRERRRSPRVLNREFVSIKVDREERPDVDRVYMSFVQATTGSGGWPMSVWLTPELQAVLRRHVLPAGVAVGAAWVRRPAREIARVWIDDRAKVDESADESPTQLRSGTSGRRAGERVPRPRSALDRRVAAVRAAFDAAPGGFGERPEVSAPDELPFLLREHARDAATRDAARHGAAHARAMALGGMRDHLGGGFHRYSVDAEWRVPHFEKMLYDQAQLVLAYLEARRSTGDPFFGDVAEDTLPTSSAS